MSPKRRKAAGRKPARARRSAPARKRRPARKRQATRKRQPARKTPAARKAAPKRAPKPAPKPAPKRRSNRRAAVPTATVRATPALETMAAAPESVAGGLELVEVRDLYRVRRGEHVFVTVNVDAAQLGEVSLFIDQTPLGTFTAPVASRDLGLADDLLGKLLFVEALVSDVSGKSNALQIRATLTGGPSPKTVPASSEAGNSGASVQFRIFVLLKE